MNLKRSKNLKTVQKISKNHDFKNYSHNFNKCSWISKRFTTSLTTFMYLFKSVFSLPQRKFWLKTAATIAENGCHGRVLQNPLEDDADFSNGRSYATSHFYELKNIYEFLKKTFMAATTINMSENWFSWKRLPRLFFCCCKNCTKTAQTSPPKGAMPYHTFTNCMWC